MKFSRKPALLYGRHEGVRSIVILGTSWIRRRSPPLNIAAIAMFFGLRAGPALLPRRRQNSARPEDRATRFAQARFTSLTVISRA
jgi:hypothetical protein